MAPSNAKGGFVTVNAGNLLLVNLGEISTASSGSGTAGTVAVTVPGLLSINGGGSTMRATGISSGATAEGDAGGVIIDAGNLSVVNGGAISSSSSIRSSGNAGTVVVRVAGTVLIDGMGGARF